MMNRVLELNNSTLGYTDDKTELQASNINDTLNKKYRYENSMILTRKDAMLYYLFKGERPFTGEETTRTGKTKKYYGLKMPNENIYSVITKTEYDFCQHILNNGFDTAEKVEMYIQAEKEKKEAEKREAEKQAILQLEKEKEEQEEISKFNAWLKDTANNYHFSTWMEICEKVYVSIYGEFIYPYKRYELLVCIENIDRAYCKNELKSRLHTDNKASRKVFECCTGLKLPKTNKETMIFLDDIKLSDFKESKMFEERKKSNKELETFYIAKLENGSSSFVPVKAEKFNKYGLEMFIRNNGGRWEISFAKSGTIAGYGKTRKEAENKLKEVIDVHGTEKIKNLENEYIKKFGLSPYFKN